MMYCTFSLVSLLRICFWVSSCKVYYHLILRTSLSDYTRISKMILRVEFILTILCLLSQCSIQCSSLSSNPEPLHKIRHQNHHQEHQSKDQSNENIIPCDTFICLLEKFEIMKTQDGFLLNKLTPQTQQGTQQPKCTDLLCWLNQFSIKPKSYGFELKIKSPTDEARSLQSDSSPPPATPTTTPLPPPQSEATPISITTEEPEGLDIFHKLGDFNPPTSTQTMGLSNSVDESDNYYYDLYDWLEWLYESFVSSLKRSKSLLKDFKLRYDSYKLRFPSWLSENTPFVGDRTFMNYTHLFWNLFIPNPHSN